MPLWLAPFCAWGFVSAVSSDVPLFSLLVWLTFMTLGLASALAFKDANSETLLVVGSTALTVHVAVAAAVALAADLDQFPGRLRLIAPEANDLAQLFSLVLLGASLLWFRSGKSVVRHPWRVLPLAAIAGVCVLGLVLTGSRTAAGSVFVVVVFLGLVGLRRMGTQKMGRVAKQRTDSSRSRSAVRWPKSRLSLLVGSGLLLGVMGLFALGVDRVATTYGRSDGTAATLNGRTEIWPIILESVSEAPLVGHGPGLAADKLAVISSDSELSWQPRHAHNLPLQIAFLLGWPGLVLAVVALVGSLLTGARSIETAVLVSFLTVAGVTEAVFNEPGLSTVALVGLSVAPTMKSRSAGPTFGTAALVGVAAVAAITVIAGVTIEPFGLPTRLRCGTQHDGVWLSMDYSAPEQYGPVKLDPMAARRVRCAAMTGSGLTVVASIRSDDLSQEGPARIFTVSDGPGWDEIDLQLGQVRDELSVRVRESPWYRTDLTFPQVFVDSEAHSIAVVVSSADVLVYRDGHEIASSPINPVRFASWSTKRSVVVGDEVGGDRRFNGEISSLRIYEGKAVGGHN